MILGIDPDLHNTGLALADAHRVYAVRLVTVDKNLKGEDAVIAMCAALPPVMASLLGSGVEGIVVEAQELYLGGDAPKGKPEDLFNLANVTGAALSVVVQGPARRRPLPKEWKGQRPKSVHQASVCLKLGWAFERRADYVVPHFHEDALVRGYPTPDGADEIMPLGNWKHVMDAVGLALWGATKGFKHVRP